MTKYTGKNMTATFGSTVFNCLTSLEYSGTADVVTAACAGSSYKARAVGTTDASFTLNYIFDTTGKTELTNLAPGTTGTFTASTNGTYGPTFSGSGIVESHDVTSPADNFVAGTVVIGIDGALTVA